MTDRIIILCGQPQCIGRTSVPPFAVTCVIFSYLVKPNKLKRFYQNFALLVTSCLKSRRHAFRTMVDNEYVKKSTTGPDSSESPSTERGVKLIPEQSDDYDSDGNVTENGTDPESSITHVRERVQISL
jgi:hypothetical protein